MPGGVDRSPGRSHGDGRLAARDQRREDGAELTVSVIGTACEHEAQPLARALGPGGHAWIGRIEADAGMSDPFESAGGSQQARFVGRSLPHATGMAPQRRREREATPLDPEGIGH